MLQPVLQYHLVFEGDWPSAVTFLDSSRRVAAANQDGEIFVWELPETPPAAPEPPKTDGAKKPDAPDHPPAYRLDGHTNAVSHLVYDERRRLLISASFDRSIRLWSLDVVPSGTAEAVLNRLAREAEFKRTKKDEVLKQPGVIVKTLAAVHALEGHQDWIHALAASADGSRLISGDASSQVIVWDLEHREPIARWSGHKWNWIIAAALSADGRTALISEHRFKRDDFDIPAAALKLWNTDDGTELLDLLKIQFPKLNPNDKTYGGAQMWRKFVAQGLVALALSADGKLIAAGQGGETDTGKVHLLERETGKLLREVSGHLNGVTDVAFSRDGTLVYSAGRDTTVRICQVEDGKELAVLGTPRGGQSKDWISAFALSPDETHLAAADIAGHVAVWKLREAVATAR
jgi:WD40 repeat protein